MMSFDFFQIFEEYKILIMFASVPLTIFILSKLLGASSTTSSSKKTYYDPAFDPKVKGDYLEELVVEKFRKLGMNVTWRGKELGKEDGGIDVIAVDASNNLHLIQCKNYSVDAEISDKHLRVFKGDVLAYFEKEHPQDQGYNDYFFHYITMYNNLNTAGMLYLQEQKSLSYITLNEIEPLLKNVA